MQPQRCSHARLLRRQITTYFSKPESWSFFATLARNAPQIQINNPAHTNCMPTTRVKPSRTRTTLFPAELVHGGYLVDPDPYQNRRSTDTGGQ